MRKYYLAITVALTLSTLLLRLNAAEKGKEPKLKDIKAYCLDFNWGKKGFAKPGEWKDADPAEHVEWYKTLGVNVIQTFAVSCNGYAWYKNGVVPEQPGLKHDFLREVVKLGHAEGMMVMGYFCIAANTRWGQENPELSYGTPSAYHIPYTDDYLAYLSSAIKDAVKTTGIDGFMIDWVWQPKRKSTNGKWIEAEKKLYTQLMNEPFPGEDKLSGQKKLAYNRKAIDRCWETIRKAAKGVNPECKIWLTTNRVNHPDVVGSNMYKEVDWLMGEKGNLNEIKKVMPVVGKNTKLITCLATWNGQDPIKVVPEALKMDIGLYGFGKPRSKSGIIGLSNILPRQLTQLSGNDKNIAVFARAYRGKSIDSMWQDGKFVEPENPPKFRIKFRGRRGFSDTAHLTYEEDKVSMVINNPYRSGRAVMKLTGKKWPSEIVVRLKRHPQRPGPTHFRIANGKIGVAITLKEELKVTAGKTEVQLDLKEPWTAQKFLNAGSPQLPINLSTVTAKGADEFLEILVPKEILEGNPQTIAFEWCNGESVR